MWAWQRSSPRCSRRWRWANRLIRSSDLLIWRILQGDAVFRKKWFWIVVVLVVIGGGAAAAFARRGETGITVTVETIQKRDLEAIVSASGKIDPKKTVNISAQTMGRVTQLAVKEGDRVKRRTVPAADRSGQCRSRGPPRRRGGGRRAHRARAVARRAAERPGQPRRGATGAEAPDRN